MKASMPDARAGFPRAAAAVLGLLSACVSAGLSDAALDDGLVLRYSFDSDAGEIVIRSRRRSRPPDGRAHRPTTTVDEEERTRAGGSPPISARSDARG